MGIWVSFQSVHGFRLTELIYAIRYFCACRTTGLGSLRGPCYPHSPRLELFITRSSGRPIRFLRIVTPHTGRGKTAHAVDAHELIVAIVDSHIRWKLFLLCLIFEVNHFIQQKQAFHSTRKFIGGMVPWVRENCEVNSWFPESSGPMIQKSCPRIGIPVPSRTKHAAGHRCWMKIGVCVICHMELRFGLHRTGSRKFYSTLNEGFDRWL